jgi:endonuclease YncB( thermonuclease family)
MKPALKQRLLRWLWLLVLAVIAAIELIAWLQGLHDEPPPRSKTIQQQWEKLTQPRLMENASNDGDSFLLQHAQGSFTARLYFVDSPEKRSYPLIQNRIQDQASYFGGLSAAATVRLGQQASDFTLRLLREQPFEVFTRWEPVYDSERRYVLVIFADGEHLAEKLVRAGLCRIHTKGSSMPNGSTELDFANHLRSIEYEARQAQRGGWARATRKKAASEPSKAQP